MHVAVDLQNLKFTHISTSAEALQGLVYLEGVTLKNVLFDNTKREGFLDRLTSLEMGMLYRNTTSREFLPTDSDLTRREVLAQIVEASTPRKVNIDEMDAQIEHAEPELCSPTSEVQFKYVSGAKVPQVVDGGLFPITAAPMTPAQMTTAAQQATQRRKERAAPTPAPPPATKPTAPTIRARGTSVRPIVFSVADAMWESAGKPTDRAVVLALRKEMMDVLETEKGIKRTSSSNMLGDWMKERVGP